MEAKKSGTFLAESCGRVSNPPNIPHHSKVLIFILSFVELASEELASQAILKLNKKTVKGIQLKVNILIK